MITQVGIPAPVVAPAVRAVAVGLVCPRRVVGVVDRAVNPFTVCVLQLRDAVGHAVQVRRLAGEQVPVIAPAHRRVDPVSIPLVLVTAVLAVVLHGTARVQVALFHPQRPILETVLVCPAVREIGRCVIPCDQCGGVAQRLSRVGRDRGELRAHPPDELGYLATPEIIPGGLATGRRSSRVSGELPETGEPGPGVADVGGIPGVGGFTVSRLVADVIPVDAVNGISRDQLSND